jgi:adenylate cyclase
MKETNRLTGRIMLVDDDEFFLSMIGDTLTNHGHQVTPLDDGVTAISRAENEPPELILLDIIMPRMDGLEVLQILKQNPSTAQVPVILLTTQRSEEIMLRGLRGGADDVMFKPVSAEELLLRCELARRRALRVKDLTEVIRRHLDPTVAYQIINQPRDFLQFKRTHIAVLFTDLRGFTKVAENIPPKKTAALLNGLFEELVRCVLRYGGTLDKFLGDGLMALFGAPIGYLDNETRAVCAALDMVDSMGAVDRDTRPLVGGQSIDMGIGISSGPVVVGPLGSQMRANYTAIGDPVNVAARLTALASGRDIIISKPVRQRLESQIRVEELPAAELKGKRKSLEIFRVLPGQKLEVAFRRKT